MFYVILYDKKRNIEIAVMCQHFLFKGDHMALFCERLEGTAYYSRYELKQVTTTAGKLPEKWPSEI